MSDEPLDDYEADPQEVADDLARIESWRRKALAEYFGGR
jgi:hypothetical protein